MKSIGFCLLAVLGFAQTGTKIGFDKIILSGDTAITLFSIAGPDQVWVGVHSENKEANWANVQVFYDAEVSGIKGTLLLHKETIVPLSRGAVGMGDPLDIPQEKVRFVRVKLLKELGQREFR